MVKKAVVISPHADDEKEGWFLHRRVSVDEQRWHEEIDRKYIEEMVKSFGVEDGSALSTPGYKDTKMKVKDGLLDKVAHTAYRSVGGSAQYVTDRRGDISFATKEVLRKSHAPTAGRDQGAADLQVSARSAKVHSALPLDLQVARDVGAVR